MNISKEQAANIIARVEVMQIKEQAHLKFLLKNKKVKGVNEMIKKSEASKLHIETRLKEYRETWKN